MKVTDCFRLAPSVDSDDSVYVYIGRSRTTNDDVIRRFTSDMNLKLDMGQCDGLRFVLTGPGQMQFFGYKSDPLSYDILDMIDNDGTIMEGRYDFQNTIYMSREYQYVTHYYENLIIDNLITPKPISSCYLPPNTGFRKMHKPVYFFQKYYNGCYVMYVTICKYSITDLMIFGETIIPERTYRGKFTAYNYFNTDVIGSLQVTDTVAYATYQLVFKAE